MYSYTFIIPHYNNPVLLNRCLETIPSREDIEIIVVDDNSDSDKKPIVKRKDVKLLYIDAEHHTGPGGARNLGIENANGSYLFFADCDDYYSDGFIDKIDRYKNTDVEMLFFGVQFDKRRGDSGYAKCIKRYLSNPTERNLISVKHILQGPVNFMVSTKLIKQTGVKFGDGMVGEDALFHHKIAMAAKKCNVISDIVYCVSYTEGSLTAVKRSRDFLISFLIPRHKEIIDLKIQAGAWDTIEPFYRNMKRIVRMNGVLVAIEYYTKRFIYLPWFKIWFHRLFY